MGYCPFQNHIITDGGVFIKVDCPQSTECQLWDSINNRCGAKTTDYLINGDHESSSLLTLLEAIIGIPSQKDSSDETILRLKKHIHEAHYHPIKHELEEIVDKKGSYFMGDIMIKSILLVNEFLGNEDKDNNNYIYGYDFKISDDDQDKPIVLSAIEDNPLWENPTIEITWNEYIGWLNTEVEPF